MLDAMRRGAGSWLAKILLGILGISFALWGIPEVFRAATHDSLASIGSTTISTEEFQQAYQEEMQAISNQLGRRLTPEQARMFGLETRVLSRLVGTAAIGEHAHDLGLSISDKAIADEIRAEPSFAGADGKFSKPAFDGFLRQIGMSEGRFLALRRGEEMRDQITQTLLANVTTPRSTLEILNRFRGETRSLEFFTLNPDTAVKVDTPDEGKLRAFYEQNKARFVIPEMRKIALLTLTPDEVKKTVAVGDEEVQAAYEHSKASFNTPEKRKVTQLAFADKAAADKAYAELSKAANFDEAAAKLGFKASDVDLGLVAKTDLIDNAVADAAFALKKGEMSKPVSGRYSTVILRVTDIQPGKERTFNDVKAELVDKLATERANHDIQELRDKVDDERNAGKTLKDIAAEVKGVFREVAAIDRNGNGPDGKPAIDGQDAAKIGAQAAGGIGGEAIELSNGGFAWLDVLGTTPQVQRSFEDVKADVEKAVLADERTKAVAALGQKLVDRIKAGESMEALAKETGSKLDKTASPITRMTVPTGLGQNAVQQAFALPKGGAVASVTPDGKSRTIVRVTDIVAAAELTKEQADRMQSDLVQQVSGDVLAEYVGGLQDRYKLSVNEAAVRQAIGDTATAR